MRKPTLTLWNDRHKTRLQPGRSERELTSPTTPQKVDLKVQGALQDEAELQEPERDEEWHRPNPMALQWGTGARFG
jgi:hypothetical protein